MADHRHLVYAIIKFLNAQKDSGVLSEDAAESLEGRPLFEKFLCK